MHYIIGNIFQDSDAESDFESEILKENKVEPQQCIVFVRIELKYDISNIWIELNQLEN